MQRVSGLIPSWDKSKSANASANASASEKPAETTGTAKPAPTALNRMFGWKGATSGSRARAPDPINTRYGKETYWPTNLDKECEKAARILKSFCTDGFLVIEPGSDSRRPLSTITPSGATLPPPPPSPKFNTKKVPARIIQNAVGIAIFSCVRSGLWMSGSGGSGILIARKADGTWSPPSGILLHTSELGFVAGVDIYDCVLVINNVAVLEMFARARVVLGTDVHLTVGPLLMAGQPESELQIRWKELDGTVLTYLKARGKHQSVQLDGSLVTERSNENERFYAGNVNVLDILAGNIPKEVPETRPLFEVIKAAEGRTDYDTAVLKMLAEQPAPGDALIDKTKISPHSPLAASPFGIPDVQDPDPFGVIALEMAGLEIREAGTRARPASSQFEFAPSPTSPVYARFNRQSVDTYLSKSNRGSYLSTKTQATTMTDTGTQTDITTEVIRTEDEQSEPTPALPPRPKSQEVWDPTTIPIPAGSSSESLSVTASDEAVFDAKELSRVNTAIVADQLAEELSDEADDADDEDEDEDEEEPVVFEVATAAQPTRAAILSSQVTQVIQAKGALVTIPKRIPPPLPVRSPARTSRSSKTEYGDVSGLRSPLRTSFLASDLADQLSVASGELAEEQAEPPTESPASEPIGEIVEETAEDTAEFASAEEPEDTGAAETTASHLPLDVEKTESTSPYEEHSSPALETIAPVTAVIERPPSVDDETLEAFHTVELTSSPENSEGEPQTPKHSENFDMHDVENMKDVSVHSDRRDSKFITVA